MLPDQLQDDARKVTLSNAKLMARRAGATAPRGWNGADDHNTAQH
jgi:hypothetical protein